VPENEGNPLFYEKKKLLKVTYVGTSAFNTTFPRSPVDTQWVGLEKAAATAMLFLASER
jgi:hypothetical protein